MKISEQKTRSPSRFAQNSIDLIPANTEYILFNLTRFSCQAFPPNYFLEVNHGKRFGKTSRTHLKSIGLFQSKDVDLGKSINRR